jgi:hypothetical protein
MPLFGADPEFGECVHRELQSVELLMPSEWMVQFSTLTHNVIHNNGPVAVFDSESVKRQDRRPNRREFERLG